MTSAGSWLSGYTAGVDSWREEPREPGARRRKIAGYLRAANELRQTYQQSYLQNVNTRDGTDDDYGAVPGSFPDQNDFASAHSKTEELILFPSYARKHVKYKPRAMPGTIQEAPGVGRDVRDTIGEGDAEYWRRQWDQYEDDNAVVDVDVRGWVYSPHRGPMSRKNRLFVGLARQMAGIPASGNSPAGSSPASRSSSPHGMRQRMEAHYNKHEEEIVAKEAESLMRKGEAEADAAHQGAYSEVPWDEYGPGKGSSRTTTKQYSDAASIDLAQKRASWHEPAQMSPEELADANKHLLRRLRPFLANPLAYTPISAFFFNDEVSRQKTIDTDAYGHFNLRAALDFVPTHVRILAAEGLSVTEEVKILPSSGVSVISDVDDTVKHSAITSGAREIFRNVFVRDLRDLHIQGVKQWYKRLEQKGVVFHYVSNSPWQLYPLLKSFFSMGELPQGSFHLKQYSGMLQGIFEPVAERKKGTLDRIFRDFPERRFLLIGDSGEADLEVYTDMVLEHPNRVLGVFIRDITTPSQNHFFDSSDVSRQRQQRNGAATTPQRSSTPSEFDAQSSQTSMSRSQTDTNFLNGSAQTTLDEETERQRPPLPPRRATEPPPEEEDLIDLSSDVEDNAPIQANGLHRTTSATKVPPAKPPKPGGLSRIVSNESYNPGITRKPAPPLPRKPSSSINTVRSSDNKASSENQAKSITQSKPARPPVPPKQLSYAGYAREKISDAYNSLPSASSYWHGTHDNAQTQLNEARMLSRRGRVDVSRPSSNLVSDAIEGRPPTLPSRKPATVHVTSSTGQKDAPEQTNSENSPIPTISHSNSFPTLPYQLRQGQGQGQGGAHGNTAGTRKEDLWKRRWARAKSILESRGVVLRSWRVGEDIEEESLKLIDRALAETAAHEG